MNNYTPNTNMALNQIEESAYRAFLLEVKAKIRSSQVKAALAVNAGLIHLYWELGQLIASKQSAHSWGSSVIEQLANDLKTELPGTSGFSRSNLFHIRKFYLFYSSQKVQQVVRQLGIGPEQDEDFLQILIQIPWGHHITRFLLELGKGFAFLGRQYHLEIGKKDYLCRQNEFLPFCGR